MKQAQVLDAKQFKAVLSVARQSKYGERDCLALALTYYAGLRVCEVANLLVGDVYDTDAKVNQFVSLTSEQTKGKKSRNITLNSILVKMLVEYRTFVDISKPDRHLFLTQRRTPFSANSLCQKLCKLFDDAGFYKATSHTGRRSMLTRMAYAGINPRLMQEIAGHSNVATTMRYVDASPDKILQAVEVV